MTNNRAKCILTGLILALLLPAVGCWDRKEIENHGYVVGFGIDTAISPLPDEKHDITSTPISAGSRKYRITAELPKFRKEKGSAEISGAQSHLIWSAEGESMFSMTRTVNTKTYFGLFFEDIQIIIFGEEVARQGIGEILDFFQRDAEMRRRVLLLVTPGRAEDILKAKLQVEEPNSIFISKITGNVNKSPYFASKRELGEVSSALHSRKSFITPMIISENKEVKLQKGAVFNKDAKMVGVIDEFETVGGKILRNNLRQGVFVAPNPANPDKIVAFELYKQKIKVTSFVEGDTVRFKVTAAFEGTLGENQEPSQDVLDPVFIAAVEKAIASQLTTYTRSCFSKLQDLKAEGMDLSDVVHREHPQYWKQAKDRWDDEIFPAAQLDTDIKVTITRPVNMR